MRDPFKRLFYLVPTYLHLDTIALPKATDISISMNQPYYRTTLLEARCYSLLKDWGKLESLLVSYSYIVGA